MGGAVRLSFQFNIGSAEVKGHVYTAALTFPTRHVTSEIYGRLRRRKGSSARGVTSTSTLLDCCRLALNPLPPSARLSASHLNYANVQRRVSPAARHLLTAIKFQIHKLTLILAFKSSESLQTLFPPLAFPAAFPGHGGSTIANTVCSVI